MATFHFVIFFTTLFLLTNSSSSADQLLSVNYYHGTCPDVLSIVKTVVQASITKQLRMGASLLRLHFHDCFVNGCDASVLLDVPNGEKEAGPNKNSARGFEVIDQIKSEVEKSCPGIVSCADLLAIAARDSVVILGGPHWDVKLGRRDSLTASKDLAERNLPGPFLNLDQLVLNFKNHGLSEKDLVVLSGAHTIGQASCITFRSRIYNETNIDNTFAKRRQGTCPRLPGPGDHNTAPLDLESATCFDNQYYKNLMNKRGLIHSDQELLKGGSTDQMVRSYSTNLDAFFTDFAAAMTSLGDIRPSPRSEGEVRRNCRRAN